MFSNRQGIKSAVPTPFLMKLLENVLHENREKMQKGMTGNSKSTSTNKQLVQMGAGQKAPCGTTSRSNDGALSYRFDLHEKEVSVILSKSMVMRTSLMVQRLRIDLAIQRMWVQSLVRELRCHTLQGN